LILGILLIIKQPN